MELQSVLKQIGAQLTVQSLRSPVLNLELESILQAKVIDLPAPSIVTLLIQGKQVTAKMDSPVVKGQWLTLQVAGIEDDGLLYFKRVETPDLNVSKEVQADRLSEQLFQQITSAYHELQLPVSNEKVAKLIELFKNWPDSIQYLRSAMVTAELGLPLTQDIVTKVNKAFHESFSRLFDAVKSGQEAEGSTGTSGKLSTSGTPVIPNSSDSSGTPGSMQETAASIHQPFPDSVTNLKLKDRTFVLKSDTVSHAVQGSEQASEQTSEQAAMQDLSEDQWVQQRNKSQEPFQVNQRNKVADSLDRLQTSFQRLSESLIANSPDKAQALKQAVETLGLQYEFSVSKLISKGTADSPDWSKLTDAVKSVLLKEMLRLQNDSAVQGTDRNAVDLQSNSLSQSVRDSGDTAWAKLNDLVDHLTGQQLLTGLKSDSLQFAYQHFAIPLYMPSGAADAQVQIVARRNASRKLDPANCTLLFQLDLPQLGKTDIWVQVIDKRISLRFITDPDVHLNVGHDDLKDLRQRFQQFGYQLGTVKEEERNETTVDLEGALLKEIQAGRTSIDLKM